MGYNAWFAKDQNRTDRPPENVRGMVFSEYTIDKHPGCTCWVNVDHDLYIEGAAPFRIYDGREFIREAVGNVIPEGAAPVQFPSLSRALRFAYVHTHPF